MSNLSIIMLFKSLISCKNQIISTDWEVRVDCYTRTLSLSSERHSCVIMVLLLKLTGCVEYSETDIWIPSSWFYSWNIQSNLCHSLWSCWFLLHLWQWKSLSQSRVLGNHSERTGVRGTSFQEKSHVSVEENIGLAR